MSGARRALTGQLLQRYVFGVTVAAWSNMCRLLLFLPLHRFVRRGKSSSGSSCVCGLGREEDCYLTALRICRRWTQSYS